MTCNLPLFIEHPAYCMTKQQKVKKWLPETGEASAKAVPGWQTTGLHVTQLQLCKLTQLYSQHVHSTGCKLHCHKNRCYQLNSRHKAQGLAVLSHPLSIKDIPLFSQDDLTLLKNIRSVNHPIQKGIDRSAGRDRGYFQILQKVVEIQVTRNLGMDFKL